MQNNVLLSPRSQFFSFRDIHDDEIEDEIREAFRCFDKEGHGFIAVNDLSRVLQTVGDKLTEDETDEFLTEADLDGDGMT